MFYLLYIKYITHCKSMDFIKLESIRTLLSGTMSVIKP